LIAVVGEKNILVTQLAGELGLAAKFTGSGGALLCLRRDGLGWYVIACFEIDQNEI